MDKVIIVTGGNRGIGLGITKALMAEGYQVVSVHKDTTKKDTYADAEVIGDILNLQTSVEAIYAADKLGSLYGLVNNAGVASAKPFMRLTYGDFLTMFNNNVYGAALMSQAFANALMLKGNAGSIVNISSVSGLQGFSFHAHYCASKFAMIGMGQTMAKELSKANIRVNTVCPGPTQTDMWTQLDEEYSKINGWPEEMKQEDKYFSKLLIKRMGTPEDVGQAVSYLMKQEYTTGITIPVCGGNIMR